MYSVVNLWNIFTKLLTYNNKKGGVTVSKYKIMIEDEDLSLGDALTTEDIAIAEAKLNKIKTKNNVKGKAFKVLEVEVTKSITE